MPRRSDLPSTALPSGTKRFATLRNTTPARIVIATCNWSGMNGTNCGCHALKRSFTTMPENERLQAFLLSIGRLHLTDWRFPGWQAAFMAWVQKSKHAAFNDPADNGVFSSTLSRYYGEPQLSINDQAKFSGFLWRYALTTLITSSTPA